MPFHIRNREVEMLARELAREAGTGLTEAVHIALMNELHRRRNAMPLWERTAEVRSQVSRRVKVRRPVDKAFRDALYAESKHVR